MVEVLIKIFDSCGDNFNSRKFRRETKDWFYLFGIYDQKQFRQLKLLYYTPEGSVWWISSIWDSWKLDKTRVCLARLSNFRSCYHSHLILYHNLLECSFFCLHVSLLVNPIYFLVSIPLEVFHLSLREWFYNLSGSLWYSQYTRKFSVYMIVYLRICSISSILLGGCYRCVSVLSLHNFALCFFHCALLLVFFHVTSSTMRYSYFSLTSPRYLLQYTFTATVSHFSCN